jgi:hypothetical protein
MLRGRRDFEQDFFRFGSGCAVPCRRRAYIRLTGVNKLLYEYRCWIGYTVNGPRSMPRWVGDLAIVQGNLLLAENTVDNLNWMYVHSCVTSLKSPFFLPEDFWALDLICGVLGAHCIR